MAVGLSVAALVYLAHGFPQRFDGRSAAFFKAENDFNPRRAECHASGRRIPYAENCIFGTANVAPETVVWGDSLGAELAVALGERMAAHGGSVMQITSSSCPPVLDFAPEGSAQCRAHTSETLAALSAAPNIRTVMLVAAFADYPPERQADLIAGYTRVATALAAAGKRLVLVYPIPKLPFPAPTALGLRQKWGQPPERFGIGTAEYHAANRPFFAMLDRLSARLKAERLLPEQSLCDAQLCAAYREGVGVLYFDDLHLSLTGARHVLAAEPGPFADGAPPPGKP
jgi:hypothetical protein